MLSEIFQHLSSEVQLFISNSSSDFLTPLLEVFPQLLNGACTTLFVTVVAVIFGIACGLILSLLKLSRQWYLHFPAVIYIDVVRGTPLLLQVLMCYFLLPVSITGIFDNTILSKLLPMIFSDNNQALFSGIIACSLNSAAYVAEIMRAGIQSIDRGQMEAARSLGLTKQQSYLRIILPQAFRRVIPPLGNEIIVLLKDSSLLSSIGVTELVMAGKLYAATTYAYFPAYIGIAIVYLVMTITISRIIHWYEKRLGINDKDH